MKVRQSKKILIDESNLKVNKIHINHNYHIGNHFYIENTDIQKKINISRVVSYSITEIFTNVNVRVQGDKVDEKINIRQLIPQFI